MQAIHIRFVILFTFLYGATAKEYRCAEFDNLISQEDPDLPYQNVLEKLFDSFNANDTESMEELYNELEKLDIDENDKDDPHPNWKPIKNVPERIIAEGYPAEIHRVITRDGYILELHRIPNGVKSPPSGKPKPPVFLMHGLLDSSNGWIVLGSENSLAYMLADAGYDVWMGNARGSEPSRTHLRLKATGLWQKEYWSFSWHEIGVHDLPTFIDYILRKTNHKKLNYIGMSQGTTAFFVMTSMRPEYNEKIVEASLLAPVAFLEGNNNHLFNVIARFYKPLKRIVSALRIHKMTVDNRLLLKIVETACKRTSHSTPIGCKLVLSILGSHQINCTTIPFLIVNLPSGASLLQGIHYVQQIRNGGFRQFDYENSRTNRRIYGSDSPPSYDLTKITAPVNLYYSKDDDTASFDNVIQLKSILPNVKSTYLVPVADFSHGDFMVSRYVRKAVNDKIMSDINNANQN